MDKLQKQNKELITKVAELSEQLERSLQVSNQTNSRLVKKSADEHAALLSRVRNCYMLSI